MLVFVPDKRSPLTGGHGGVRVQPQTLCTTEQESWARHRGAENNEMEGQREREDGMKNREIVVVRHDGNK